MKQKRKSTKKKTGKKRKYNMRAGTVVQRRAVTKLNRIRKIATGKGIYA